MTKPNLFIIGEQKCGTTSIHNLLNTHPDIFFTPLKEPGHFCTDFHKEADIHHNKRIFFNYRDRDKYLKLFKNSNNEKYLGESSSIYFYSKTAISEIASFSPEAKIILILRDPVSFLPSLHAQYLKEQTENITSLKKALELEKIRRNGKNLPKYNSAPSLLYYSDRIKYSTHLKRVYKYFNRDSVLVLFFEDFKDNPQKTLREIFSFLELKQPSNIKIKHLNRRTTRRFAILYKPINNPIIKTFLQNILSIEKQIKIKKTLDFLFLKQINSTSISEELKLLIQKECIKEMKSLENLLSVDLPWDWVKGI